MVTPETLAGPPVGDVRIPPVVRELAGADAPVPVWRNELGGITFRAGERYLKWNPHGTGLDLGDERERLQWAGARHPVPRVVEWGADAEAQWLVTVALPGESAVSPGWRARPLDAAAAIGRGLRALHEALPVAECPYTWSVESRSAGRMPVGEPVPPVDRLVVCHGDACAPNTILAADGEPAGHVDLGSLGVADRWADLAVASMSLGWNFGSQASRGELEAAFLAAYGVERDEARIRFYRALWDAEEGPHPGR